MALIDYFEEKLPGWMRRTSLGHWLDLMGAMALVADAAIDGLFEARLAAMPGQVSLPGVPGLGGFDSLDALPLIGRDRRIVRGLAETVDSYAEGLRRFRQAWRGEPPPEPGKVGKGGAGTPRALLEQLARILSPNPPRLRMVCPGSLPGVQFPTARWWTREPDGTFLFHTSLGDGLRIEPDGSYTPETGLAHPWDWDSLTVPPPADQNDPGRIWVIIYAPCNQPFLADIEGQWGDGTTKYGDGKDTADVGTEGTTSPKRHVDLIRGLVTDWRAAGIKCSRIIIAFDPASFDPLTPGPYPASGMPDGYWGHHTKLVPMPFPLTGFAKGLARNQTARYWRGTAGDNA